jgi:hypothetical protein
MVRIKLAGYFSISVFNVSLIYVSLCGANPVVFACGV